MSFYDAIRVGASGAADFEIERSLRFNRPDSTYLTKSLGSTSNRRTFTYSFWVKRTVQNSEQCLIYNGHPSSTPYGEIRFEYQGSNIHELNWYSYDGSHQFQFRTNRKFRDPSAWYHIVLALDTTQSTQSNRAKIYVNGIQETSFKTETYPSQNTDTGYNVSGNTHSIGGFRNTSNSFDGYVAEFNFIDGQQLTPSSFAETNSDTGQWVPIDTSGLTFGTNGFRLKFADNSGTTATTLGKDSSGNGNNFTPNNFSVSAGAGNDSLEDTPTNNFCIINPLAGRGTVFLTPTNGNLDFSLPSGSGHLANASFLIPTSGKWYAEYVFTTVGSGVVNVGNNQKSEGSSAADQLNGISMLSGEIRVNDSSTQTSLTAFGNNDIIGVKVDRDAGTVAFTINGSAVGNAENISSMNAPTDLIFRAYRNASGGSTPVGSINFGQRPFSYLPTGYKSLCSQNLSDPTILLPNKNFDTVLYTGNGATSARAITGFNFAPDWVWLKNRDTTYHHQLHDTVRGVSGSAGVLYSNNTNAEDNTYSLASFNSDGFSISKDSDQAGQNNNGDDYVSWCWNAGDTDGATYRVVVVSDSGNKYRFRNSANTATFAQSAVTLDLAEGGTYIFNMDDSTNASHPFSIGTAANGTVYTSGITYFLDGVSKTYSEYTSGFAAATTRRLHITVPASAPVLYYWCSAHSGMGGQINTNSTLGSSNFDGSIQSTVKANTSAGFSIVTYTGNGSAGATIGHGLGVKPDAIIIKRRDAVDNWMVYHNQANAGVDPEDYYGELNSTSVNINSTIMLNDTAPTSTSITLGGDNSVNGSSATYVMYCFSSVDGFSKFDKYYGNFDANGTFIYTGFRPAWLMVKQFGNDNWYMVDNKRDPFNVMDHRLFADVNSAEGGVGQEHVDFLSNGFKWRRAKTPFNNTFNYLYFCFAEAPFKNSRAR